MIVVDANVLIGFLETENAHHTAATALLSDHADEGFLVNALTLAEVLVTPQSLGRADDALRALAQLDLETADWQPDTAIRLAQLRVSTALKMPDCCVIMTAIQSDSAAVASFDKRLGRAAKTLGLRLLGFHDLEPTYDGNPAQRHGPGVRPPDPA